VVSHGLDYLGELCNSVIWLDKGMVREKGEPKKVIAAYKEMVRADAEEEAAATIT
jgi:ABC-type polysaccharide/polyol phosphate transport system ATPase subunit